MPTTAADNKASAQAAGLLYINGSEPGLTRARRGSSFIYRDPNGRVVRDATTLDRIRALAIPPAWTDVWICARRDGHLQATGRDARGRKQHRYHPGWTAARSHGKFDRLIDFAHALPAIRRQVKADLRKPPLSRERVLATVVALLDKTLIRIGNEEYARTNDSFGLTTMRDEHVRIAKGSITFRFRAKSGVLQTVELNDASIAKIVRTCRALPGKALFQYVDGTGRQRCIGSGDVNAYLRRITGGKFTAKNFRTWAASVLAAMLACDLPRATSAAAYKRQILPAIDIVARKLGNTRAICRKCYIHPAVFEAYREGHTIRAGRSPAAGNPHFSREEAATLALLKRRSQHRKAAA